MKTTKLLFADDLYVATPEDVKHSLYCLIATTDNHNIDSNVNFLYQLLTEQGVTL